MSKKNVEGLSFGIVYTLGKCAMVIGDMSLLPHACSKRWISGESASKKICSMWQ